MTYLFIGERRSGLAIKRKLTWESGGLAAKQLFDALNACGIDPRKCLFANLFDMGQPKPDLTRTDVRFVGMGLKVQRELDRLRVPHLKLVHPAARGKIRKKEVYIEHVRDVLCVEVGNSWETVKPELDVGLMVAAERYAGSDIHGVSTALALYRNEFELGEQIGWTAERLERFGRFEKGVRARLWFEQQHRAESPNDCLKSE